MNEPKILECTLRDGSYAHNFKFSQEDTYKICNRLDKLGFELIEVGHGVGLDASRKGYGLAEASDIEYMAAASSAVKTGKWGMFCIPGIADLSSIKTAAEHKMDFIRIGCDVDKVDNAAPYIDCARESGMYVFSNLMKSYACDPKFFAQQAAKCVSAGAQCIYLVDSAGGMLTSDIDLYTDVLRSAIQDTPLGFHGHHNLGMGIANSLRCLELGYTVVDSSLQGFGRSTGNTPTEQLVAVMQRAGYEINLDPIEVMEAGEELIRPLITTMGLDSLDVTSGLAQFHSSYMERVITISNQYLVDPRRVIIELCGIDRINAPEELVHKCAQTVLADFGTYVPNQYKKYFGNEQNDAAWVSRRLV